MKNVDEDLVRDFGDEWQRFDQSCIPEVELKRSFDAYFSIFPFEGLPPDAVGADIGCGSGRWARFVAARVGKLHCIDPSDAIEVARRNLGGLKNCEFHRATVDAMPIPDGSLDFCYSLGVLHHVPDTELGVRSCVATLKPGGPFLIYLYYAMENRPSWFRALWRCSDIARRVLSGSPRWVKIIAADAIAALVYMPLSRTARVLERLRIPAGHFPLSEYRDKGFYTLRTDALDRFGTRIEHRFTQSEIRAMMERCGLRNIVFRNAAPYWCAVGYKIGSDPGPADSRIANP